MGMGLLLFGLVKHNNELMKGTNDWIAAKLWACGLLGPCSWGENTDGQDGRIFLCAERVNPLILEIRVLHLSFKIR
jgi:hypothetical protein